MASEAHDTRADDGRHDFDFFFGSWQQRNRKRVRPLVPGDDEWIEFESRTEAWPILGGLGNVDMFSAPDFPGEARVRRVLAPAGRARDRALADLVGLDRRQRPARPARRRQVP